mmetsp:Transcript_36495/g.91309  ORF Transcript_36495/g.91309 Transcript_36495/m.91309 type:complete len:115 (+) Transcript_36495:330-674(+)
MRTLRIITSTDQRLIRFMHCGGLYSEPKGGLPRQTDRQADARAISQQPHVYTAPVFDTSLSQHHTRPSIQKHSHPSIHTRQPVRQITHLDRHTRACVIRHTPWRAHHPSTRAGR